MQPRYDIFFNLLKACRDGMTFYPTGNPIVTQQVETFIRTCGEYMTDGRLVIRLGAEGFSVGGTPLPAKLRAAPGVAWLAGTLAERHIHTLVIEAGLDTDDVGRLVSVLEEPGAHFDGPAAAGRLAERLGLQRIVFNDTGNPAPSAFDAPGLDATFSDLSYPDRPPPLAPHATEMPAPFRQDLPGAALGSDPVFAPTLLIAAVEQATLYNAMVAAIDAGNLKRVAETLSLIRADLKAATREDRELAYSSYQVVVNALIARAEERSLSIVLKSMPDDLFACEEPELFRIHQATLYKIMQFFLKADRLKVVAYGLNTLANQNLRRQGAVQQQIQVALKRFLDTDLTARLLMTDDPGLVPVRKALFHRHGMGVLQPLLAALFDTEDRNLRKKLLEVITKLGSLCYPILMIHLEQATADNAPWYVKRNLLTLLSINPPADLMRFLPALYEGARPKMRDLVVRCLYQIYTPDAFKLGKRILRESSGVPLMKALRYVEVGKHAAYGSEVMQVFLREEDDTPRKQCIAVLGKIDTDETVGYLADILERGTEVGRVPHGLRAAAAGQLGRSKKEKALKILLRNRRDTAREVREAVMAALGDRAD